MMIIRKLNALASALMIAMPGPVFAAATDLLPPRAGIEALPLNVTEQGLEGPGADRLRKDFGSAQFVAIGEDHGFSEPPELATAISRELARLPGTPVYHAVEVGPLSTRAVSGLLRRGGLAALDRTLESQPFALPFLGNVNDAELALPFAKAGRLWGIDQEFIGSAGLLFDLLAERTDDSSIKRQLTALRDQDRTSLTLGQFDKAFMTAGDLVAFEAMANGFGKDRVAREIIAAIVESARIYRYNEAQRYFESNETRALLMRDTFTSAYREVKNGSPRVVLKLGAYHLGRGTTPTAQFDIGSLLPGLAAANGKRSLHIAMVPISGSARVVAPSAEGFTAVKSHSSEDAAKLLQAVGLDPASLPPKGLLLIPLEPVRRMLTGKARRALPEFASFIALGYDYLITTRDGHAATHFETWSPPGKTPETP